MSSHQCYYPLKWETRVQGRKEMSAICSAAKRDGAVLLVRLTGANCGPCERTEPMVRAMLDAVAGLTFATPPPELRVYSLDVDQPGSVDVYNFYTNKLCRGTPAVFVYRGSDELRAPDICHDGAELHGLARAFARAAAVDGPRDLRDEGAMYRKAEPDLAYLRSTVQYHDAGVHAVLQAAEPFLAGVPLPRASTVPSNASELVGDTRYLRAPPPQTTPPVMYAYDQQQLQYHNGNPYY